MDVRHWQANVVNCALGGTLSRGGAGVGLEEFGGGSLAMTAFPGLCLMMLEVSEVDAQAALP